MVAPWGFHPRVPSWKGGLCACWAMTQLKPPETHGGEATHSWVNQPSSGGSSSSPQDLHGRLLWLTCCCCVLLPKDTAEQTAVLEEVWSSAGARNDFRALTMVPYTQMCVLLLLVLMLLRTWKQEENPASGSTFLLPIKAASYVHHPSAC